MDIVEKIDLVLNEGWVTDVIKRSEGMCEEEPQPKEEDLKYKRRGVMR